jgi:hypothetical protein
MVSTAYCHNVSNKWGNSGNGQTTMVRGVGAGMSLAAVSQSMAARLSSSPENATPQPQPESGPVLAANLTPSGRMLLVTPRASKGLPTGLAQMRFDGQNLWLADRTPRDFESVLIESN